MEKYGFIYLWFDKKHKRFYIGRHWGTENDGYICSSSNMRNNHNNRSHDFKRRIISRIYTSNEDLIIEEQRWLDMIKPEELNEKYYNKTKSSTTPSTKGYKHSVETIEKIKKGNRGKTISEETKQLLREANRKQFENKEQREIRKQKSLELWSDPEYIKKQKLMRSTPGFYKGFTGKHSEESKQKMREAHLGHKHTEKSKNKLSKLSKDTIWINNGEYNKRINKYEKIPEGFTKGILKNG